MNPLVLDFGCADPVISSLIQEALETSSPLWAICEFLDRSIVVLSIQIKPIDLLNDLKLVQDMEVVEEGLAEIFSDVFSVAFLRHRRMRSTLLFED